MNILTNNKIAVIGAGLGGLSVAALLAQDGHSVTVFEKNNQPGGRAIYKNIDGFKFDLGPSWYMMPDVFDFFFDQFNKSVAEYYEILKLDPSYKIYFEDKSSVTVKPDFESVCELFESIEKGSGNVLRKYIQNAKEKYNVGVPKFLLKSYKSPLDLFEPSLIKRIHKMGIHKSFHKEVSSLFKNEKLQKILEFMVVFLGGSPYNIPALYTLVNWADLGLNIYYPNGGFSSVSKGMEKLAKEMGVEFKYNEEVRKINCENNLANSVTTNKSDYEFDIVVANADYHHVESSLLDEKYRSISQKTFNKMTLAPSGLCILLGLNKKIENINHHTLFFNDGWKEHFDSIENVNYPNKPQYYVCAPSKTDNSVAPENHENLFILVPIASKLKKNTEEISRLYNWVINDLEEKIGENLSNNITTKEIIDNADFSTMFNAYGGNAFGLAHTLKHSIIFRPKNWSKKVKNLYFTGHFTNPGTGTPLVVLSGIIVRDLIRNKNGTSFSQ